MKISQEDRKRLIKKKYKRFVKREVESQRNLELNYYIQKKMMDYPSRYIDEIRKDIKNYIDN